MAREIQLVEKEFVLKSLIDTKSEIEIRYLTQYLTAILTAYDKETISFRLAGEQKVVEFEKNAVVNSFFYFRHIPIACKSSYLSTKANGTYIFKMPASMYRDLTRLYRRVEVGDRMVMSIILNSERVNINFPTSASYFDPEQVVVDKNFELFKITDLTKSFRKRCEEFSFKTNIDIFQHRQPESIMEQLTATSGKSILLPLEEQEKLSAMEPKIAFVTLSDIHWVATELGENPPAFQSKFQSHLNIMKQQKISAELYVPILCYEYVIGYIYLSKNDNTVFNQKQLDFVHQFSRLMAYSLKSNGYFKKKLLKEKITDCEIVDLSASGLLFSYPHDATPFELYQDVNLMLDTGKQRLSLSGKIVRKFKDAKHIYLGIQFLNLSESTQDQLSRELYGDAYDTEIEISN